MSQLMKECWKDPDERPSFTGNLSVYLSLILPVNLYNQPLSLLIYLIYPTDILKRLETFDFSHDILPEGEKSLSRERQSLLQKQQQEQIQEDNLLFTNKHNNLNNQSTHNNNNGNHNDNSNNDNNNGRLPLRGGLNNVLRNNPPATNDNNNNINNNDTHPS